ncbi:MAG: hypothetical protein ACM3H7_02795 [Acidobacteriaceae bacterium]
MKKRVILALNFGGKEYTGYGLTPSHVDGDGPAQLAIRRQL